MLHAFIVGCPDGSALEYEWELARDGEHGEEHDDPHANALDVSLGEYSHDENGQA